MSRFEEWIGLPELSPPSRVKSSRSVDEALENGEWRGVAVFVHEADGWSVFDDYTGHLASIPAQRWAELARDDDLVFTGYNDAIPYGQLIVIRGGTVVREFLDDEQQPADNVNRGRLPFEDADPINDWIDAAAFVDGDDLGDPGASEGLLWLFRHPAESSVG